MFGIGLGELIIIVLAVLIFVKPRDFPGFLRKLGYFYRKLRIFYEDAMDYMDQVANLKVPKSHDNAATGAKPQPAKSTTQGSSNTVAKKAKHKAKAPRRRQTKPQAKTPAEK